MLAEISICVAIAFAIILGIWLIVAFCLWLDQNKGIDVGISALTIISFITLTFGIWIIRYCMKGE